MDKEKNYRAIQDLTEADVFALLVISTTEGEVVLRPIGGQWGSGIRDAIAEMSKQYPDCKMQLFNRESNWKHFDGIVTKEQVLPYAAFSPELRASLDRLRRQILL